MDKISEDWIRTRAYEIWESEGRCVGHDQAHWFKATQELAETIDLSAKPAKKAKPKARKPRARKNTEARASL
ncbi:DUF2934 domain-containing protein [Acuticoccus sp. M5D2P5]|uniref:DUF2934 domain-containing protein n=1 Tax=Acuticoccus kalidii TaxID=2910977 RepID=UPI001F2B7856|nr:DUF2934 domain-containing protein [Acuticoccus kalidii]MCF3934517.1 DUF2934 domain-containing protein [Acuticoccus kalidii]